MGPPPHRSGSKAGETCGCPWPRAPYKASARSARAESPRASALARGWAWLGSPGLRAGFSRILAIGSSRRERSTNVREAGGQGAEGKNQLRRLCFALHLRHPPSQADEQEPIVTEELWRLAFEVVANELKHPA